MTAPALPGAAPDPARLPPEVEEALSFALADAPARGTCDELLLRTAIARALGGDGEPVAWGLLNWHGKLDTRPYLAAKDAERHRVVEESMGRTLRVVPLHTRPVATGAEVERAVAEAVKVERSLAAAVCRYKSSFFHHTTVGKRLSASDCAGECADQIERGDYSDAIKDIAAAIRARGVARPRTDGEASEQGAKS